MLILGIASEKGWTQEPAAVATAIAEAEAAPTAASNAEAITIVQKHVDFVWTLVAAFLVFFMQAGFALVETGFTRAKNAVNICMKNLMDFCVGSLAYWLFGFGLMFGINATGFFGTSGFMFSDFKADADAWLYAFWMFQVVFAATAATIVSGAMAERTKFSSYLVYSAFISALLYPVFGSWAWGGLYKGGGWLEKLGFIDFAGSTVVHSIGGWSALAGAIILGPRIGKFGRDGKPRAIPGHNLVLATLGVFILWFGWFGFNSGSTTAANKDIALIAVTTNLAAASGAISSMLVAWMFLKKPDGSMMLNGVLAGLVAVTAGCANVSPLSAVIIGLIAGALVVGSVIFFDRIKVDDPVGAVSVHGVNGAWGTLAAGIFSNKGFSLAAVGVQALGVAAAFIWAFPIMLAFFYILKTTIGLRVSVEEEMDGLDINEHGNEAYAEDVVQQPSGYVA
ncbi:MAG: ammonium transporter [Vicinamibacteria bacterium]|nr:ammonium transporter [Vicinamibacteria bacterium]